MSGVCFDYYYINMYIQYTVNGTFTAVKLTTDTCRWKFQNVSFSLFSGKIKTVGTLLYPHSMICAKVRDKMFTLYIPALLYTLGVQGGLYYVGTRGGGVLLYNRVRGCAGIKSILFSSANI